MAGPLFNHAVRFFLLAVSFFLICQSEVLAQTKRPLLVCLPGAGSSSARELENWKSGTKKTDFILIGLDMDYAKILDENAVNKVQARIHSAIADAIKKYGADPARVYLGGTSAGGALAIALSLKFPKAYQAVGILGGSLQDFWIRNEDMENAMLCRYLFIHGEMDPMIPLRRQQQTVRLLTEHGAHLKSEIYPDEGHALPASAYEEVKDWFCERDHEILAQRLPSADKSRSLRQKFGRIKSLLPNHAQTYWAFLQNKFHSR
jgi:predicted esterase